MGNGMRVRMTMILEIGLLCAAPLCWCCLSGGGRKGKSVRRKEQGVENRKEKKKVREAGGLREPGKWKVCGLLLIGLYQVCVCVCVIQALCHWLVPRTTCGRWREATSWCALAC